jgi:hypothetical protein
MTLVMAAETPMQMPLNVLFIFAEYCSFKNVSNCDCGCTYLVSLVCVTTK